MIEDASTSSEHRVAQTENLNRSLGARTINLICLGGVIGTGIFLGMGKMLLNAGPLGLLLNYLIMGSMIYFMMLSLGEMSVQYPYLGHLPFIPRDLVLILLPLQLYLIIGLMIVLALPQTLSLQLVMQYWTNFHWYVISIIFWVFLLLLNVLHVRLYAEAEYSLALLKVVTIIIFFIVSIICNAGKIHNTNTLGLNIGVMAMLHLLMESVDSVKSLPQLLIVLVDLSRYLLLQVKLKIQLE